MRLQALISWLKEDRIDSLLNEYKSELDSVQKRFKELEESSLRQRIIRNRTSKKDGGNILIWRRFFMFI